MTQIRRVYILVQDGKILDAWTNLKKLCEDMREDGFVFPSYSTLAKKAKEAKIIGHMDVKAKDGKQYTIVILYVR